MSPYQTLQVYEKASIEVIRAAWAALVRECHPDGPKPNEKRTRALNEAYAILKDPVKRAALDQEMLAAKPAKRQRLNQEPPQATATHGAQMPGHPPAYPDPYMGMSQESVDGAIDDIARAANAPPFVSDLLKFAHHQARRRAS